jgi:hypothetical protein
LHISCELDVVSNGNHLQQLYLGFEMLAQNNKIILNQKINNKSKFYQRNIKAPFSAHSGGLRVICNGKKLYYSTADSHEVNEEHLDWCDIFFKRSFNAEIHNKISSKIAPLDLNYMLKPSHLNRNFLSRAYSLSRGKERLKNCMRELDIFNKYSYLPRINEIQNKPNFDLPFRVLFMARLWEPGNDEHWNLNSQQNKDREEINSQRINCIRLLKEKLGSSFVGGVASSDFALKECPDIVFDSKFTSKRNYIKFLKEFPICISTTGLMLSTGWKFGEYVALSKGIISEKLYSETAGNIQQGVNYLQFTTPQECLDNILLLKNNKDILHKMMNDNYQYYNEYLRPDKLIYNSLQRAIAL